MDLDVGDFGVADAALVVLDAGVALPVVLEQLGQGVELERAVRTLVVLAILDVALHMPLHPPLLSRPEGAPLHLMAQRLKSEFGPLRFL